MSRWTAEELRELVTLWPMSTATQIAYRLHRPRAAICGKAKRCSKKACWKVRTPSIPIRESGERAPNHRKSGSCSRHHKATTASRCSPVQSLSLIKPAAIGRSARSTRSLPSFAAVLPCRVIAIARTICEWRVILSFKALPAAVQRLLTNRCYPRRHACSLSGSQPSRRRANCGPSRPCSP